MLKCILHLNYRETTTVQVPLTTVSNLSEYTPLTSRAPFAPTCVAPCWPLKTNVTLRPLPESYIHPLTTVSVKRITHTLKQMIFESEEMISVLTRLWFSQKNKPSSTCGPETVWVLWTSCLPPSATGRSPLPPWWPSPRLCGPSGPRCGRDTPGSASCPLQSAMTVSLSVNRGLLGGLKEEWRFKMLGSH